MLNGYKNPRFMTFHKTHDVVIRPVGENPIFIARMRPKRGKWRIHFNTVHSSDLSGTVLKNIEMYHNDYVNCRVLSAHSVTIQLGDTPLMFFGEESQYQNEDIIPKSDDVQDASDFLYAHENTNNSAWIEYLIREINLSDINAAFDAEHHFIVAKVGCGGGHINIKFRYSETELVQIMMEFVEESLVQLDRKERFQNDKE